MSELHQREAAIFDAAMELPPEQRAAHLDQACGGDAALRQRIEALLKAGESRCEFLDSPTDLALRQTRQATVPLTEKPGDQIGHYKLLEQIGEGGCGVVYVAEQTEPVRRRVALKIIKLGMDTRSVIARFEAERQALALMDHPNIAKVFDAGATETGRPYFVMELVRGMKITDYCDEKKLPTRARLDLFILVCHAIQHAHQKGIIHRDIKPSNILVTVNDGVAVPKVIDFGVAKATGGQQLTDKTVYTAFEQFIGTPAYMSPEQAVLTSLDIDTRSDIYALGVLLYELLTGQTPFDAKELLLIGLDEMRRTIRETEPSKPSTRLSTLSGQELSTTAQRRGLDAPKLVSELRGDLDWIVMKALEKDRARRYETANGLAMDIQRHLSNEPVVACPPSRLYRFRKMLRRNRLAFAAGSAVTASLVIGLTLSTFLFFRERVARKQASEQAAMAQAVNMFLQADLLRQASGYGQAWRGYKPDPNLTVREALERAAKRVGDRFKNHPLQEAMVRYVIGNALVGVGEAEQAIPHLQRSLQLSRAGVGLDDPNTLTVMRSLGIAYEDAGKLDQAIPLYEEALKLTKTRLGQDNELTLGVMSDLAMAYEETGRLEQALPLYEKDLKLSKAKWGPGNRETLNAMNSLASAYDAAGKRDQGQALLEETLKLMKAKLGPDDPYTQNAMLNLAIAYRAAGKLDQALSLFEEALKLRRAALGPDHPDTLLFIRKLAQAYQDAGKLDQARSSWVEALKLTKAKLGPDNPKTLDAMNNLAGFFVRVKNYAEAETLFRDALNRLRPPSSNAAPREIPILGLVLQNLSEVFRERKMLSEARTFAEEAMSLYRRHPEWPARDRGGGLEKLSLAYSESGKYEQALPLFEENLELKKATLRPDHQETLEAMNKLALAYRAAGKLDQALPLLEETLRLRKIKLGKDNPDTLASMNNLAVAYGEADKLDQALQLFEETLRLRKIKLGKDNPDTLASMNNLALAYRVAGKLDLALPILEETLKLRTAKLGPDDPDTLNSMGRLAKSFVTLTNYAEAETWSRRLITRIQQREGPPSAACANTLASLGRSFLKRHEWTKAEPVLRECLAIREKIEPDKWGTFSTRSMLGGALLGQRKLAEAQPLVVAGYDGLKKLSDTKTLPGDAEDDLTDALNRLEMLYEARRDEPEAAGWQVEIARVRRLKDPGAVRRWLILAPIALPVGQSSTQGLEVDQLSNEGNLCPRPGDKVSVRGRELVWREYPQRDYLINFNELMGGETPRSVAYAVCYVQVTSTRKDLVIKVGSDDQARLYLNGQKIYENKRPRPLTLDEDTVRGVALHTGLNVVVFKVVNGLDEWRGSLRFADQADQPVEGIKITPETD